jgi:hypothetical protein
MTDLSQLLFLESAGQLQQDKQLLKKQDIRVSTGTGGGVDGTGGGGGGGGVNDEDQLSMWDRLASFNTIDNHQYVSTRLLLQWLFLEQRFMQLQAFLQTHFPHRVQLLERCTGQSSKYRIRSYFTTPPPPIVSDTPAATAASTQYLSLIELFEKFESHKEELFIDEYSAGQTTLEQIFNHFAAQQTIDPDSM